MPRFYLRKAEFFPELEDKPASPFNVKLEVDWTEVTIDIVMALVTLALFTAFVVVPLVIALNSGNLLGK